MSPGVCSMAKICTYSLSNKKGEGWKEIYKIHKEGSVRECIEIMCPLLNIRTTQDYRQVPEGVGQTGVTYNILLRAESTGGGAPGDPKNL